MISRRRFLQNLGITFGILSTGLTSVAHAFYQKMPLIMGDFGGLIRKKVAGFTDDTQEVIGAIKRDQLVHPRGTGHSVMGKSIRKDALIFTPEPIDISFNAEEETVYASAGSTLLDIDNYLEDFGYMVPTSPDHRAVSLGGVLSVGGYGVEVCKHGPLVEHVVSVDLLKKDGEVLRNVSYQDRLVRQVLAGIGQHDIILAAKIRCLKKPLFNHLKIEKIKDVDHYVDVCRQYIEAKEKDQMFDIFYAHWSDRSNLMSHGYRIHEHNRDATLKEGYQIIKDYRAHKKKVSDDWTFRKPYKYFVWSDHFFKIDDLKTGLEKGLAIKEEAFNDGGAALIYSSITKTNKTDEHFPHYMPDADYVVSVGMFMNFLEKDKDAAIKCAKSQMLFSKEMQERFNAGVYRYGWMWDEDFNFDDLS